MSSTRPQRAPGRRSGSSTLAALVVAGVALLGALAFRSLPSSPSAASSASSAPAAAAPARESRVPEPRAASPASATPPMVVEPPPPRPGPGAPHEDRAAHDQGDGAVPDGTTVFDDEVPAVANLDPALLVALREAAADAGADGVTFTVTSGWRSPAYQERLLREAVATYGSEEEAARWVATPTTSAHVSGDAVDLGSAAASWLSRHGAAYGLCQIYDNETWHHELRPDAATHGCPARYADPTHDPRMQP
jgi:hypothetical protein